VHTVLETCEQVAQFCC